MKKRLVSTILSTVLCVSLLAGCGADSSNETKEGTTAPSNENSSAQTESSAGDTTKETVSKEASGDKQQLTVWHYWVDEGQLSTLDKVKKEFEEANPNTEVVYTYIPRDELDKQYTMGAVSGELPDIMLEDSCVAAAYIEMGICADITDYVNAWEDKDKILEQPLAALSKDGRIYGLPQNTNCLAVFYDKDAYEEAGISQIPGNWDELMDVCGKLKEKFPDKYPFAFSANDNEEGTFQFLPFFLSTGATLDQFGSEEGVKAITLWKDMVDKGYVPRDVVSWGQAEVNTQFEAGNVLMQLNGSWNVSNIRNNSPDKNWSVFLIPKDKEYASTLGGESFAITTACKDMDLGWKYMQTLCSGENEAVFAEASANFSARTDANEYSDVWTTDEILKVFNEAIPTAFARGPNARWTEISKEISGAIQAVLTNSKTPEAAMTDAQDKINEILNEGN